ncbi:MAG: hypothetical protein M3Q49_07960 [Actinomycetota bacterium]|nr:hypothetical protein [Actinomycetota bacterium]
MLSSTQTVSPASPSPQGIAEANLKAARNEFESFQVFVQADGAGIANLKVDPGKPLKQIDPATGQTVPNGPSIPADNLTFYREHFLNITTPSDNEGAVGKWPDDLIPEKDYIYVEDRNAFPHNLDPSEKAVAWVDVLVPENQPAGTYRGSVPVICGHLLLRRCPGSSNRGEAASEAEAPCYPVDRGRNYTACPSSISTLAGSSASVRASRGAASFRGRPQVLLPPFSLSPLRPPRAGSSATSRQLAPPAAS